MPLEKVDGRILQHGLSCQIDVAWSLPSSGGRPAPLSHRALLAAWNLFRQGDQLAGLECSETGHHQRTARPCG